MVVCRDVVLKASSYLNVRIRGDCVGDKGGWIDQMSIGFNS